jgi:hypothetical protein
MADAARPSDHAVHRLVDRYGDVTVRDLAWLLFAPDLLRASHAGAPLAKPFDTPAERDATLAWLDALDRDPRPLHARSRNPKLTRLGFYAESLLEFFLTHGPAARLVAANVPLRKHRLTIGECDFLLQTAAGARLHWELAVKFYLHIGDGSRDTARLSDYVGPNLQDRFDLKHARLITHQLALSSREEFASLGFGSAWTAQLYIKGRLFYHGASVLPAPELGDDHLRGWWLSVSEWSEARSTRLDDEHAWVVQPRLAWLASRRLAAADAGSLLADAAAIHERLQNAASPTMVASYARDADGGLRERSRGFIVPDDWPERARAYALTTI